VLEVHDNVPIDDARFDHPPASATLFDEDSGHSFGAGALENIENYGNRWRKTSCR
jgi:hypothetical protein